MLPSFMKSLLFVKALPAMDQHRKALPVGFSLACRIALPRKCFVKEAHCCQMRGFLRLVNRPKETVRGEDDLLSLCFVHNTCTILDVGCVRSKTLFDSVGMF